MSITEFYTQHKFLAWSSLGVGLIIGYLGHLLITWIQEKLGLIKKVDEVAEAVFKENLHAAVVGKLTRKVFKEQKQKNILAVHLQAAIKAKASRSEFIEKRTIAAIVQGAIRGKLSRDEFKKEQIKRDLTITLQSAIRGKRERSHFQNQFLSIRESLVPFSMYEKAIPRLHEEYAEISIKADLSVVVKNKAHGGPQRHNNNLIVSRFVREKDYKTILVPKSRLHNNIVIETLLPIVKRNYIENFGFYIENYQVFNEAVTEFFDLMCHIRIDDIKGGNNIAYGTLLNQDDYGRYDNVCLYIHEGIGKIGLVDLEGIGGASRTADSIYFVLRDLIALFPLHYSLICKLGFEKNPDVKKYDNHLVAMKDEQDLYMKTIYTDHRDWQKKKGLLQEPNKPVIVSDMEILKQKLKSRLMKLHCGDSWYGGFLGHDPEKILNLFFADEFDPLLEELLIKINENWDQAVSPNNAPACINFRTVNFYLGGYKKTKAFPKKIHSSDLLFEIFFALKEAGDIFDFRPKFGVGGYAEPTVFC